MKKLFLIFLCLLWSSYLFANVDTLEGEAITTSTTIEGVSTTDTVEGQPVASGQEGSFHIEFDSDTDWTNPAATYTMGGNDYSDGASTGTVTGNVTRNTTEGEYISAGQSLQIDTAADGYISFSATSIITLDKGEVHVNFYPQASTGYTYIFEAFGDVFNLLTIALRSGNDIKVTHKGNGTQVDATNGGSFTDNQWNEVQVRWDASLGTSAGLQTRVCSDGTCDAESWVEEDDSDTVTPTTADAVTFYLGGDTVITDEIELDDITIYYDEWN